MFAPLLLLATTNDDLPPVPREFRAAWVATVDNIDWPSKRTLSTSLQKAELIKILNTAQQMRLNALILQVRPSADALYDSRIEPWSEFLTGRQGKAPKPFYDPLAFAVEEAHKRGLELHVWLNPYRARHPAQKGPLASDHIGKTHPQDVKTYSNLLWMDPGSQFVQKRTLDVVKDIVSRYDIDGVHIDDYFYPYPAGGKEFPDDVSYTLYRRTGGNLSKGDWRRLNVDHFVESLYRSIKDTKRWVKFGISPFGIYRPGIPSGIKAGIDQYGELYADAKKWLNNGWCDYYTPQLYWPVKQTAQAYPTLLNWWISQNIMNRNLWPGLFTSRTSATGGNWKPTEILNQIRITRKSVGATGNVHFSMKAFMQNYNGVRDEVRGIYSQGAIPPRTPWLDNRPPEAPSVEAENDGAFAWRPRGREQAMWWVVWRRYGEKWVVDVQPSPVMKMMTSPSIPAGRLNLFAVAAVDRCGNVSLATRVMP